jgi:hypothetical protein
MTDQHTIDAAYERLTTALAAPDDADARVAARLTQRRRRRRATTAAGTLAGVALATVAGAALLAPRSSDGGAVPVASDAPTSTPTESVPEPARDDDLRGAVSEVCDLSKPVSLRSLTRVEEEFREVEVRVTGNGAVVIVDVEGEPHRLHVVCETLAQPR